MLETNEAIKLNNDMARWWTQMANICETHHLCVGCPFEPSKKDDPEKNNTCLVPRIAQLLVQVRKAMSVAVGALITEPDPNVIKLCNALGWGGDPQALINALDSLEVRRPIIEREIELAEDHKVFLTTQVTVSDENGDPIDTGTIEEDY